MAQGIRFCGANGQLNAAPGTEEVVGSLPVCLDRGEAISCWRLSPEELAHVLKTGEVWLSVLTGNNPAPPVAITGFPMMKALDNDTGEETTYYSDGRHVVEDARQFATLHHGAQLYGNGEPYTYHLGKVVQVLRDFNADWNYLAAGWLHDVLEDCFQDLSMSDRRAILRSRFGQIIEELVWACTGVGENRKARNADQYAKIKALTIAAPLKIADRIANMEACVEEKNPLGRMYVKETEEFDTNVGVHTPPEMRARYHVAREAIDLYLKELT